MINYLFAHHVFLLFDYVYEMSSQRIMVVDKDSKHVHLDPPLRKLQDEEAQIIHRLG